MNFTAPHLTAALRTASPGNSTQRSTTRADRGNRRMTPATKAFARAMAIQAIGYWRTGKMPKTRAYHRRYALALLRMIRTGVIE